MGKRACPMSARECRLFKNSEIEHLLGSKIGLGSMQDTGVFRRGLDPILHVSAGYWRKEEDINVETSLDNSYCGISGSALLSPGLFLLADDRNCSVKIVDLTTRIVTSRLQLQDSPCDVCVLPADQAAVTLQFKSIIQLLSTKGGQLSCGKELKMASDPHGIASYNNKLYVSYLSDPRIEVMTLDGHIISIFKTDGERQLFKAANSLTVSASTPPTIYVSDQTKHTVLQLSLDGKVLRNYSHKMFKDPLSLVEVGPDQVLVCGQSSHNIFLLRESSGSMVEILTEEHGLNKPCSMSFCPHKRALIVGICDSLMKVSKLR